MDTTRLRYLSTSYKLHRLFVTTTCNMNILQPYESHAMYLVLLTNLQNYWCENENKNFKSTNNLISAYSRKYTNTQCPQIKLLYSCASFAINFLIVSFVPILPRALRNGIPSKLAHNTVVALNCHLLWRCWKRVPCLCRQVV